MACPDSSSRIWPNKVPLFKTTQDQGLVYPLETTLFTICTILRQLWTTLHASGFSQNMSPRASYLYQAVIITIYYIMYTHTHIYKISLCIYILLSLHVGPGLMCFKTVHQFFKYSKLLLNKGKWLSCNGTEPITLTPTRIGSRTVENFYSRIRKWREKKGISQYSNKFCRSSFMAANVTILVFLEVMPLSLAVAMFCRANLSPHLS